MDAPSQEVVEALLRSIMREPCSVCGAKPCRESGAFAVDATFNSEGELTGAKVTCVQCLEAARDKKILEN